MTPKGDSVALMGQGWHPERRRCHPNTGTQQLPKMIFGTMGQKGDTGDNSTPTGDIPSTQVTQVMSPPSPGDPTHVVRVEHEGVGAALGPRPEQGPRVCFLGGRGRKSELMRSLIEPNELLIGVTEPIV